ncbi:MAG TPA: hypothetical protein VK435_09610 [Thermodesulfovibrionales bacterium]|nr:hypothetical protein [Thermodesulfovibrionales bacterium]
MEEGVLNRLEDFISLAKSGEGIDLTVSLNRHVLTRKFYPYKPGESEDEIDMYFLAADFVFKVGDRTHEITKFYASGIEGDSASNMAKSVHVANERLRMDYKRLIGAGLVFSENFWDEKS